MRKKRNIEGTFVRVTCSELYFFEPRYSNNWTIEEVIDNWFIKFPINSFHVSRDGSKVGNSKKILNIEIIDEKDILNESCQP